MKKRIDFSLILMIILIIITVGTIIFPKKTISSKQYGSGSYQIFGEIKNGDVLEQQFVSDGNYNQLGVRFATYAQMINKGNLIVEIIDQDNHVEKKKLKLSSLMDSSYYYFDYKLQKNKKYTLKLRIQNSDFPITVYTFSEKKDNSNLYFNHKKQDQTLWLSFLYNEDKDYYGTWYSIFALVLVYGYRVLTKYNKE